MKRNLLTTALLILAIFANCQKAEEKTTTEASMTVKNYEGHLHIGFLSNDKNMQISFYPCGVNQLFAIAKVSYFSSRSDYNQGKVSSEFSSGTDWIGPYFVCSASSVNTGIPQKFTGGWHGSNGDGTGIPTASTSETRFEVDGKETSGNFGQNCNQIDLHVTNLIHGYDYSKTNVNLLKESVHYCIKPNRVIEVEVKIEALEDAVIQRYYGLQSQNYSLFNQLSYIASHEIINTEAINTNSRCAINQGINTILLNSSTNQHQLRLLLNTLEGLGAANHIGSEIPKAFSANYGKSYFNLVNGKDLPMKKGEKVFWKGSYIWDED